jgi:hypothetical protein
MASPSQVPVRYPSGVSTDQKWGPLADFGLPNPFMYHVVYDDFDGATTAAGVAGQAFDPLWVIYTTAASGGTTVNSNALTNGNGEGGQWLFTTGAAGGDIQSIEMAKASFILPPAVSLGLAFQSKKLFFLARINVTNITNCQWTIGLINQSATPVLTPTDGIALQGVNATTVNLVAYSASTLQWTVPIPSSVLSLYYANATWVDIGFYMDRLQNVYAMMGFPLVGWLPASAWTGVNNVNAQQVPKANVAAFQGVYNGAIQIPWTPSTALLTPAVIFSGNAQTAYLDFLLAAKER